MHVDRRQLYLRAEPSAEGRAALVAHRRRIHETLTALHLTPRLTERSDLHRTELFLGSPDAWQRACAAVGARVEIAADDLLSLIALSREERVVVPGMPRRYEPFFTGGTGAVFVLRLTDESAQCTMTLLRTLEDGLRVWERQGRLPAGTPARLLEHPLYPLRRYHTALKPHVTLARGRVSRVRQRDVARSLHATALASASAIPFVRIDVRRVRSTEILRRYVP